MEPNPEELARLIIAGGKPVKPVWVPQSFWPSDIVERGGWWLRFTRVAGTRLEYQILDRREQHVEGDVAIWERNMADVGGAKGACRHLFVGTTVQDERPLRCVWRRAT